MSTIQTRVKYSLPFIGRSKLHRVELQLRVVALGAVQVNLRLHHLVALLRALLVQLHQPLRRQSRLAVGDRRRQLKVLQMTFEAAKATGDPTVPVDVHNRATIGTKVHLSALKWEKRGE